MQDAASHGQETLLHEDFSGLSPGMFSANVGPHTEYHFLPEAAPRGGWAVACFGTRPAGTEWWVKDVNGARVMEQAFTNERAHTHPMLSAGDDLWGDYRLAVHVRPMEHGGRCGVVFRYHNNRCYYFFGLEEGRAVLLLVRHELQLHQPDERELAATPLDWQPGGTFELAVRLRGEQITAEVVGRARLQASDYTYLRGKIALLADRPAQFLRVDVTALPPAIEEIAQLRSRADRELADLRAAQPRPALWRRFSTPGFGVGRNVRFGDLDGDGRLEIVIGQVDPLGERDDYSQIGCITAVDLDGEVLWQSGTPNPEQYKLTNDVAFQVHDLDGDGKCEVLYARDFELVIADGATGEVSHRVPTPLSKPPAQRYERILGDCLFFCDLRGTGRLSDIVVKDRYWNFWVYDEQLRLQWAATCNTGHYPFAFDVDGDGHDELAMGYSLYDHDGTLLWSLEDRLQQHVDGVAILNFAATESAKPRILYAASDEGLLFLDLDGTIRRHHRVGHAQNPVVARFRDDLPGLQTVSINFWGNQGILNFYDAEGRIYHDAEPLNMGSMCLPINWDGSGVELFVHNPHPTLGGMFDGWGRPVVGFPDDGHPNMCNAVVDLTGDCRDEVVVWNPQEIWIYTQDDGPRTGRLYRPIRNALFNSSNYQVSVSLPGWSE